MLPNKDTTIVSEIKDFFTTSEKAIQTILTVMSSLTLSEKQFGMESKSNNTYKNSYCSDRYQYHTLCCIFQLQKDDEQVEK